MILNLIEDNTILMTLKIRKATKKDVGGIVKAYKHVYPHRKLSDKALTDYKLKQVENDLVLVAESDGIIVGSGALSKTNEINTTPVYEMAHLFVVPEYQGMGIGRALVEERIKNANGIIITHVRGTEVKAQHLIYTSGLRPMGIIPRAIDFGDGREALIPFSSFKVIPTSTDAFVASFFAPVKFANKFYNHLTLLYDGSDELTIPVENAILKIQGMGPVSVIIEDKIYMLYKKKVRASGKDYELCEELKMYTLDNHFVSYGDLFFRIYYNLGIDTIPIG